MVELNEHAKKRLEKIDSNPVQETEIVEVSQESYDMRLSDLLAREENQFPAGIKWPFKKVLNGHLMVQIDAFRYKGRIIIPETAKRKPTTGIVVGIADDITDIVLGDKLLFSQFAGYLLIFRGFPVARTIGYSEVLSVLDHDSPEIETEG